MNQPMNPAQEITNAEMLARQMLSILHAIVSGTGISPAVQIIAVEMFRTSAAISLVDHVDAPTLATLRSKGEDMARRAHAQQCLDVAANTRALAASITGESLPPSPASSQVTAADPLKELSPATQASLDERVKAMLANLADDDDEAKS